MSNANAVGALFGLLLGLTVQHSPVVVTAQAAPSGPVAAIEKARTAAAAESQRARASDAEAARIFAPSARAEGEPAASTSDHGQPDAVASRGPADTGVVTDAAASGHAESSYDPAGHRDPFRPPNLTPPVADKGGPRTPLEAYELGQLKLVGIVREGGTVRAMVEDSAGLGYIVTTGTPIGSSGGVVSSIDDRRMLIEETTTNFYGEKQAKEVVMELPQEDRSP
jgi:Tfp pilus assembly protein PilP